MKKMICSQRHPVLLTSHKDLAKILRFEEGYLNNVIASAGSSYQKIDLKKKDGRTREINSPYGNLKGVQNSILYNYLYFMKLPSCVYGCTVGKSIIENAMVHKKSEYMLNLDIKDFFPSVHYEKILQLFIDIGCSEVVAKALCKLTTLNYVLPQGSKTSPYLSNLVLENLDKRMIDITKQNRLVYTRYFDDITISGDVRVLEIQQTIEKIIKTEGYKIKSKKTNVYGPQENKRVTGIIIKMDGTLDVDKKEDVFVYLNDLKNNGLGKLDSSVVEKERQSLQGKIAFINSVDPTYGKLLKEIFNQIDWPEK